MVTRTSSVIPDLTEASLKCRQCGRVERVPVANGRLAEPAKCGAANSFDIQHNHSSFADRQHLKIQEAPEAIPQGETPQTLNAIVFEDLVDCASPGDRVEITGVWRASPGRVNPRMRTLSAVCRTYIDVVHVRKQFAHQIDGEDRGVFDETTRTQDYDEQRRARAEAIARDPDVYAKLVESFAPSIWQMDDVKMGLLCMLFGGSASARVARRHQRADGR
jgi:DNA replication licensing factor MCM4